MKLLETLFVALQQIAEIGGPVVILLMVVAILTLAVILYKLWQFTAAGVGRHLVLTQAIQAHDSGEKAVALATLDHSKSYLKPIINLALQGQPAERLQAEAEARFGLLERGLRFLDSVAQLAPLLGLFGTVLGMIDAFQALQSAGSQVDPSILAGGIWVALLTTAVGLVVAMPTALVLSWFEGRMEAERIFVDKAIYTILFPGQHQSRSAPDMVPAYG